MGTDLLRPVAEMRVILLMSVAVKWEAVGNKLLKL